MNRYTYTIFALLFGCVALTGCANRRNLREMDCCAEIPAGHVPEPAGRKVCEWQTAQVANAEIDQRVLYRSNFVGDSTILSQPAQEHLRKKASVESTTLPWVIEPSGDRALDAARVEQVSEFLAEQGATPIVTIATPAALGLRGPQAEQAAASLSRGSRNANAAGGGAQGNGFGLGSVR